MDSPTPILWAPHSFDIIQPTRTPRLPRAVDRQQAWVHAGGGLRLRLGYIIQPTLSLGLPRAADRQQEADAALEVRVRVILGL